MPAQDISQPQSAISAISDTTRISRSPAVIAEEVDGEVVMMNGTRDRYFNLDEMGRDIWRRMEQPCTFRELIDGLADAYDADRKTIAGDVSAFLRRLIAEQIILIA
ncbi:MAG TPA: PqqD family peptide modification chaperone [Bryobacteraceae bacterium]|jgi:hypothetical protein|nr:PqqD family peptide modification chaperone [Bryobacteraceae bacterium]